MNYSGINHIALATRDMERTIRFWRDLLGLRLLGGIGGHRTRQYFFEISPGCMISFFEWPDVEPVPDRDPGTPFKGPMVFDHLCIEVEDMEELWALKDRLEAADAWTSEVLDNGFIYSLFSTDPNNIQIEICCRVEGVDPASDLKMADPAPPPVAREGSEPRPGVWPPPDGSKEGYARKIYRGALKEMTRDD